MTAPQNTMENAAKDLRDRPTRAEEGIPDRTPRTTPLLALLGLASAYPPAGNVRLGNITRGRRPRRGGRRNRYKARKRKSR